MLKKTLIFLTWVVLIIWQLPQTIVGIVMLPFMGELSKVCLRNYCLCLNGTNMRGGISLGCISIVSNYVAKAPCEISHEVDGHTVQSKLLGPLYLFVIGIPSITWALFRNKRKHPNYYSFYTESWANECAGLEAYKPYPNIEYYTLRKKGAI